MKLITFRGTMKDMVYRKTPKTLVQLKHEIIHAFNGIPLDSNRKIIRACNFKKYFNCVIDL